MLRLPDDFGLTPTRTLAHVSDPTPSPLHQTFWSHWKAAVDPLRPELRARTREDPADPSATHEFDSLGGVRIGCRMLAPPEGAPMVGGVVILHGYGAPGSLSAQLEASRPLADAGVMVLGVRVRGYPGSSRECGDWLHDHAGYAAHGLTNALRSAEAVMEWSVPQAVADAVLACRALRAAAGERGGVRAARVALDGESFGGGLAVIAASKLAEHQEIDRLCVALPSLGDWAWRLAHASFPGTAGAHAAEAVAMVTRGDPERERAMLAALRLCDAVVHAARVKRPTLALLACRDEAVPAPTAAAVFNALGSPPACKWRRVAPCGHFDAGLKNARAHARFAADRLTFLDLSLTPDDAMARRAANGERP